MKPLISISLCFLISVSAFAQTSKLIPFRKGDRWGYSDANGNVVIQPTFERTWLFSEADHIGRIKQNGLYGYVNEIGTVVIRPQFTSASDFVMGAAKVTKGTSTYCINLEGEKDECNAEDSSEEIEDDEDNLPFSTYKSGNKTALIIHVRKDTLLFDDVRIVSKYIFPGKSHFAVVKNGSLYNAYNRTGENILPVEYDSVDILDNRSFKASKNKRWGVRTFRGGQVLPFEYDSIRKVEAQWYEDGEMKRSDHFIVSSNGKSGVVNSEGGTILPLQYDAITYGDGCTCPVEYVVKKDGLVSLVDYNANIILQPRYKNIQPFKGGDLTIVVGASGKEGYVSRSGKEYFAEK